MHFRGFGTKISKTGHSVPVIEFDDIFSLLEVSKMSSKQENESNTDSEERENMEIESSTDVTSESSGFRWTVC